MKTLLSTLHALLYQLSGEMTAKTLDNAWSDCLEALAAFCSADIVILLAHVDDSLQPIATHGLAGGIAGQRFKLAESHLASIATYRGLYRFDQSSPLPDSLHGAQEANLASFQDGIGIALHNKDRLVGIVVLLAHAPCRFDTIDNDLLIVAANLLGACLRLADSRHYSLLRPLEGNDTAQPLGWRTRWRSPAMCRLDDAISLVAPTDMGVLLLGETGVGKERVARQLHMRSARHDKPFIKVNCAALPEHLVESELFGHSRGAFSGAIKEHRGHFSMADGGTLMLDEIGELPLTMQPKLLRVLQEGEIQPLGSERSRKVDVRMITVTNRNLAEEVAAGRFREDLYHRLSAFPLQVPRLCERQEDISLLVGEFLEDNRIRLDLANLRLSDEAERALVAWHWPGNVRELEHTLSRAALRALGGRLQAQQGATANRPRDAVVISVEHLDFPMAEMEARETAEVAPSILAESDGWLGLREATERFQRQYIQQALSLHEHNWAATARSLAIDSGNLHRLGKRLGLK